MDRLGRVVPHAKAADEGVGIIAGATSSWQLVHVNDVATTYYDILGLKCRDQTFDHVFHELTPAFLAEAVEARVMCGINYPQRAKSGCHREQRKHETRRGPRWTAYRRNSHDSP